MGAPTLAQIFSPSAPTIFQHNISASLRHMRWPGQHLFSQFFTRGVGGRDCCPNDGYADPSASTVTGCRC